MKSTMIDIIGLIGSICLSMSALPQVIKTVKQKHANGVSAAMLWLWFTGVVLMLAYTFRYKDLFLILNYTANSTFVGIILYFKYFGKK